MKRSSLSILIFFLVSASAVAAKGPVNVDCDKGKTIMDTLSRASGPIEIRISGACNENVLITSDDVTIAGEPGATLTAPSADYYGAIILIDGANRFAIRDLQVSGGAGSGIVLSRGASGSIDRVSCVNNARHGMVADEESSVRITSSTFSDNGRDGIGVWGNSEAAFYGTISCERNARIGIIVSSGAAVEAGVASPAFVLHDNRGGGLHLQNGATGLLLTGTIEARGSSNGISVSGGSSLAVAGFDASGNNFGIVVSAEGHLDGRVASTIMDNARWGISVDGGSSIHLENMTLSGNRDTAYVEDSIAYFGSFQTSASRIGLWSRNSSVDIWDSTWTDGLRLEFGTLIEGLGNTISSVDCDGTVVNELDYPCGFTSSSAATMETGRHRTVAGPERPASHLTPMPR